MITGANSGIGKAVSVQIASMGATVVMVCRDVKRGESERHEVMDESGNQSVELLLVNLASLDSLGNWPPISWRGMTGAHPHE